MTIEKVDQHKTDGCQRCLTDPTMTVKEIVPTAETPPVRTVKDTDEYIELAYKCLTCGYEWITGWAKGFAYVK